MKKVIPLFFIALSLCGCTQKAELPQVDSDLKERLKNHIRTHYMTPEQYIISKFRDHDLVFVGEFHRIKHHVEFVGNLIPKLHENGIFFLATEFARREDQHLLDSLVYAPDYDEELARKIIFNEYVHWGYQEYADIFKAAWRLNSGLAEGGRKFRVLGLNDSPDWSIIKTKEDLKNEALRRRVWKGGGEHFWAGVLLDSVVAKGEKALVHSGIHHAFTEFKQPIYDEQKGAFIRFEDGRMGNYVYREIGKRAITVYLHAAWPSARGYKEPLEYPADGIIDAVMAEVEPEYRRVGFDTKGTPFGKLPGSKSIYKHGYDKFMLEMFCDGYIFQKPLSEYEGVTPIKSFVNEENLEAARLQSPNPRYRKASVEDFFNSARRSADIKRRFARFE